MFTVKVTGVAKIRTFSIIQCLVVLKSSPKQPYVRTIIRTSVTKVIELPVTMLTTMSSIEPKLLNRILGRASLRT